MYNKYSWSNISVSQNAVGTYETSLKIQTGQFLVRILQQFDWLWI